MIGDYDIIISFHEKIMKILLTSIFIFLGIVSSAYAVEYGSVMESDFFSTSTGSLPYYNSLPDYQYPWYRASSAYTAVITDTGCVSGNCLRLTSNDSTLSSVRKYTLEDYLEYAPNYISVDFKFTAYNNQHGSDSKLIFGNFDTDPYHGILSIISLTLNDYGSLMVSSAGYYQYIEQNFELNTWHNFQIKYNDDSLYYKYDDYAWTMYERTDEYPGINLIDFSLEQSTSTNYLYIDNFIVEEDVEAWADELYTLATGTPDYFTVYRDVCFLGETCPITIYYNQEAIGTTVYYIPDGVPKFPEYSTDEFILPDSPVLEYTFEVQSPTSTEPITTLYNLWYTSEERTVLQADKQIVWVDRDTYELEYVFDINTVCDDVATSSGSFADDMRFGVECGFRKLIYWTFTPSGNGWNKLTKSTNKLMTQFPFSYIKQVINSFQIAQNLDGSESYNISMNAVLPVEYQSPDKPNIFEKDMVSDNLGALWTDYFYDIQKSIFYILMFFYFVNRFLSMSRKGTTNVG